jgi:D-3-phosphoglycerate dehydrogenase
MSEPKIVVVDDFRKEFLDKLKKFGKVVKLTDITGYNQLDDVNILVVRSKTKVGKDLVDRMPSLKSVITATHGTDHVAVDYLKMKSIEFCNVAAQCYDVAQGVLAYILAKATNLVDADRSIKKGEWKKKELKGFRIKGKTLGVIGCGGIGREVVKMASALEMNVIVYDPYVDMSDLNVSLDELLETSDFITVHIPLTEKTRGLIGKNEIKKMKTGAYIINTARGGIVDEEALLSALNEGIISGAALDVYKYQPPFKNEVSHKLIMNERVMASPHSIGQTSEAVDEKGEGVIEIICNFISKNN